MHGPVCVLAALLLEERADVPVDGRGGDGGFHHDDRALGADIQHLAHRRHDITGIGLFGAVVIGRRHGDDVSIRFDITGLEPDARIQRLMKQRIEALFLKGQLALVQRVHQCFALVRSNDLHAVRGEHQCGRKANVTQSFYIYHDVSSP